MEKNECCLQLFDFDVEVQPVLEVLVGKLVEQALLEVQEEEELAALREQQRIFEELRNAEFEEQQRLEEQERRIKQEKVGRSSNNCIDNTKPTNLYVSDGKTEAGNKQTEAFKTSGEEDRCRFFFRGIRWRIDFGYFRRFGGWKLFLRRQRKRFEID